MARDLQKAGSVAISTSSSGATALVSAVSGKRIVVTSWYVSSNGTVNVKFQSASTDLTGLLYLVANVGCLAPDNGGELGWFRTAVGEALNINLSAAVAVGGVLNYVEV